MKNFLERSLSRRKSVQELRERNILTKFDSDINVQVLDGISADDRKSDATWSRLSKQDKLFIRKELNEFKSSEMQVQPPVLRLTSSPPITASARHGGLHA